MSGIQPQLWVDRPAEAIAFYQAAFSATVVHQVGEGEDTVAQLAVGDACFWVASADPEKGRFSAAAIDAARAAPCWSPATRTTWSAPPSQPAPR